MKLGLHLSIQGSIDKSIDRAIEKKCDTLQIFSRNPRRWQSRTLNPTEIQSFKLKLKNSGIWPVFIHTPYLVNLTSPKKDVYQKSIRIFIDELRRAANLNIPYVVTHLGSHLGWGKRWGCERIIKAVNTSISKVDVGTLLFENTAGTRNSIGSSFDDIAYIISKIKSETRVGVCFDTCHAFAAGYELISTIQIKRTLRLFDKTIGINRLNLVHLNDSAGACGSRIDRHEHIGLGQIGEHGFRNILRSKLGKAPLILETPIDKRRNDTENLKKVRELANS